MIDYSARQKYLDNLTKKEAEKKHQELLTTFFRQGEKGQDFNRKIGDALVKIWKRIPEQIKLPEVFNIRGDVSISRIPPVRIDNLNQLELYFQDLGEKFDEFKRAYTTGRKLDEGKKLSFEVNNLKELEKYFTMLSQQFSSLTTAISKMPPPNIALPKIELPKQEKQTLDPKVLDLLTTLQRQIEQMQIPPLSLPKITFPKPEPIDFSEVVMAIEDLKKSSSDTNIGDLTGVLRRIEAGIASLVNRPQMTPQPVTNVWLNPNQGFLKTTDNTVGITATTLPGYGQLIDRRSILIYNNSSKTIYIGGSDVTVANGLPVPAASYAPPIDAGYNLPVYGVASTNGNSVRVIEISKDQSGSIQE
jgi:hypothetical protein